MYAERIRDHFSVEKAHKAQLHMSQKIIFQDRLPKRIRLVAGVDTAYTDDMSIGSAALLRFDSLRLVEAQTAFCRTQFPYVPTLLSFRETRPAVLSVRRLERKPDVILVDGHGFAHPYHCGFASHLGLVLGMPTIGVAKNKLTGEIKTLGSSPEIHFLEHDQEVLGAAVTAKDRCRPVYVSVGHMVSLRTAVKVVRACTRKNRIPEPIRAAHSLAAGEKRKIQYSLDN
jgi:deoxyribonuclease V